ncbi:hypothetical protein BS50DRAFT_634938 [Corynespora cassiicola Philippines]|uniref:Uncharacterized protein n=1 Tax=Corynespora cassiicola Philippines TaxID=1448308 RepID=A0A2T2NJV7_CORCC|nr:hypothetical protein BS50DRAFT_634938 [Corynespora cassiicola Philippines]
MSSNNPHSWRSVTGIGYGSDWGADPSADFAYKYFSPGSYFSPTPRGESPMPPPIYRPASSYPGLHAGVRGHHGNAGRTGPLNPRAARFVPGGMEHPVMSRLSSVYPGSNAGMRGYYGQPEGSGYLNPNAIRFTPGEREHDFRGPAPW